MHHCLHGQGYGQQVLGKCLLIDVSNAERLGHLNPSQKPNDVNNDQTQKTEYDPFGYVVDFSQQGRLSVYFPVIFQNDVENDH